MKKVLILIAFLAIVGWVGYQAYDAYKAKAAGPGAAGGGNPAAGGRGGAMGNAAMMRLPLVDTAKATEGMLEDKVLLVGSLRPIAEVQVMSKIAGRVQDVFVDVGDRVQKGQLLAQVEDREILQDIQQAEAAISVSRASIMQRQAELENYERQVRRYRELFEQNLIARQDLEDYMTRQKTAEAQLELSKAQLRQSEANLNRDKISLENTRSYASMDGFASKRFVHPGALVALNTPIVTIVDLRTMRMIINAVEKDIVRVARGVAADVSVDAFPGRSFRGKVLRLSPVLDPATRTAEVEVHVDNSGLDLRGEMFARVVLNLGGQRKGLLVPREAVVYRGENPGVFTLDGNVARFRTVEVGITQQGSVEVVEGLKDGENVVSMGASLLKDGDQVRLKGESPGPGRRGGGEKGRPTF